MSLLIGTLCFLGVGVGGALCAPLWAKKQTGLVQVLFVTCATCMWLSYALIYISQVNPLLLPTRNIKKE